MRVLAASILLLLFFASSSGRVIVDTEGREVDIPDRINRAVIMVGEVAELLYSWGEWDKVVGVNRWIKDNPLLSKLVNFENIEIVGTGGKPNIERIVSLRPDIVITYGGKFGYSTPKRVVKKLEGIGIPVILVELGELDGVFKLVKIVGEIFHEEDRARETLKYIKGQIEEIKMLASKIPSDKRVKVIRTCSSPTRVVGGVGVMNDLIKNAGGINPASEIKIRYATVPIEKIIFWNPDVILIWSYSRYDPIDLMKDPKWSAIKAVRNRRVYKEPKIISGVWGIRVALMQAWIFDRLYPGMINFSKVADRFFRRFYGIAYR